MDAATRCGSGAKLALSYALLGAFAMAVAHSGLPPCSPTGWWRTCADPKPAPDDGCAGA